jgi:hypothetical protein
MDILCDCDSDCDRHQVSLHCADAVLVVVVYSVHVVCRELECQMETEGGRELSDGEYKQGI